MDEPENNLMPFKFLSVLRANVLDTALIITGIHEIKKRYVNSFTGASMRGFGASCIKNI